MPAPAGELYDEFIDLFFNFANAYTEESVRFAVLKEKADGESGMTAAQMKELGYTDEDIAAMRLRG